MTAHQGGEPSSHSVFVCQEWLLTPERVALHHPTGTAVVADLHLGYDLARRGAGEAVPLIPLKKQLQPLERVWNGSGFRRLVIAGDLLENRRSLGIIEELLDWLEQHKVKLAAIIPGNHDRWLQDAGPLPLRPEGVQLNRWQVVHGHETLPAGPVVHGHLHPGVRWQGFSAPCYLVRPNHLVLPAYSAEAAGTNILRSKTWQAFHKYVIGGNKVLNFGTKQ
jgi:putative SbcD/Mre11-related phosphoesterase